MEGKDLLNGFNRHVIEQICLVVICVLCFVGYCSFN